MKEKMLKINLLLFHREQETLLEQLQELGILHLVTREVINEKLEKIIQEKARYQEAIKVLDAHSQEQTNQGVNEQMDPAELREQILALQEKIENAKSRLEQLGKEKKSWQPWGRFSWQHLQRLEPYQVYFRFYVAPAKDYRKYDFDSLYQFTINQVGSLVYFVVINRGETPDLPFDEIHLPQQALDEIEANIPEQQSKVQNTENEIAKLVGLKPLLENRITELENQVNYQVAQESCESYADGNIRIIQGWMPQRIEKEVRAFLDQREVSYLVEEPDRKDKIPVILKNKGVPKYFEPITKIFQLPSYYEYDLTPVIAVFYPVFFAYCLGDAGYGFTLVVLSLLARNTLLKDKKVFSDLGLILGLVSLVLGIIKGGTLFGIPIIERQDIPVFNYLSQYILVPDDPDYVFNTFNTALLIGLFQIILGVLIAIFRKIKYDGFIFAVATVGKLFMIIGAVILFLGGMQNVVAIMPYTTFGWVSFLTGIVLVLLFHDPTISIAKRLGGGILPVYFIITGFLGDTLSYIRLFALGVASSILGLVVNQIGNQIMSGGIIAIIIGVIFLIFGHSLNLALASLGSFVHPLRLTFVEFYNNAEFKGGGIAYTPFKKQQLTTEQ